MRDYEEVITSTEFSESEIDKIFNGNNDDVPSKKGPSLGAYLKNWDFVRTPEIQVQLPIPETPKAARESSTKQTQPQYEEPLPTRKTPKSIDQFLPRP